MKKQLIFGFADKKKSLAGNRFVKIPEHLQQNLPLNNFEVIC